MTDLTVLKPCPFCGGKAVIERYGDGWSVGCEEPEASIHYCMGYQSLTTFATQREAEQAWNQRHTPAMRDPGMDVERVAKELYYYGKCEPIFWGDITPDEQSDWRGRAKAAISAMREPGNDTNSEVPITADGQCIQTEPGMDVERVARAIAAVEGAPSSCDIKEYYKVAKAAISAMQPTPRGEVDNLKARLHDCASKAAKFTECLSVMFSMKEIAESGIHEVLLDILCAADLTKPFPALTASAKPNGK